MFRKNEQHRQQSYLSGSAWLPEDLREQMAESWVGVFYREVLCRIDEEVFAELYSETASRPNTAGNVLVSVEVLKSGWVWSDEVLHEQRGYNLRVRYALGLGDLRAAIFTLRTG